MTEDSDSSDLLVVWTDSEGLELDRQAFGGVGFEAGYDLTATADGAVVAVGSTTTTDSGDRDVFLVRLDSEGHLLWSKSYGGPGTEVGRSVIETSNGDLVVCATTDSSGAGEYDLLLLRVNADGNLLWSRTFGGDLSDFGRSVTEAANGDLLASGATGSFGGGNHDVWVIRTDAEGNELWSSSYGADGNYDWGDRIITTSDGGAFVIGSADNHGSELQDIAALFIDPEGKQRWYRRMGQSSFYDTGSDGLETAEGDLLVLGTTISTPELENDVVIRLIGRDGFDIWSEVLRNDGAQRAAAVVEVADGYVIAATTFEGGNPDLMILKLSNLWPRFGASTTTGNAPLEVCFEDHSTGAVDHWLWDLDGDHEIDSIIQNPCFTYTKPGDYDVELIIVNQDHSQSLLKKSMIKVQPAAPRRGRLRARP